MKDQQDLLKETMFQADLIRNMSVIAHVDHGKSTLSDSFIARAGMLSFEKAGGARDLDTMKQEKDRGITIRSSGISLFFTIDNKNLLMNLIDCPGHVDFSSEVSAALRVTDGALVVVDTIDGVCVQTERVLRQACTERIKSCLMINKVDRAITEKQLSGEEMYYTFSQTIEKVNGILSTYYPENMQEQNMVDPVKGNVAFGAGRECWAFTIQDFAKVYSKILKTNEEKMAQKLWGDNFFDPVTKTWKKDQNTDDGRTLKRAFVQYILDPIISIYALINNEQEQIVIERAEKLGIKLTAEEMAQKGKVLRKTVMRQWLNAADNLLHMIINHLPSPKVAMQYRTELLYEGPNDDQIAQSMRNCDLNGPLVMYISKMVPNKDQSKFLAFGRVFSGTAKAGQKVIVLGPNYTKGQKNDYFPNKNISQPVLMMGKQQINISEVPCGNICALVGFDDIIIKTATLTTEDNGYPLRTMKLSVAPVVRVAVQPKIPSELPKLLNGLKKLQKSDPLVLTYTEESTGEHIIAGSGELHIQVCLNLLSEEFAQIEIISSDPVVNYLETVSQDCIGDNIFVKSVNKLNKLWGHSQSMNLDLVQYLDEEHHKLNFTSLEFQNKLATEFQWERDDTKKIWAFSPELNKTNVLVDACSQVQGLQFIKDSIISGFEQATNRGVLIDEFMRGFRFNLKDAQIHSDPAHRGVGQVMPMARRLFYAGELSCNPRLMEPVFITEVQVPSKFKNQVYNLLNRRRAEIYEEELIENTPLCIIRAWLPVSESFGFTDKLRLDTEGSALDQCVFHHYQIMQGDPMQCGNKVNDILNNIRFRKGMKIEIPKLTDYIDKI